MAVIKSDGEDFQESMVDFHDLVAYLYGRPTKRVILMNSQGFVVNTILSSVDLFTRLQPDNDISKLFANILKNHSLLYYDGGLLTALLASNIILKTRVEDIPFSICITGNNYILQKIIEFINKINVRVDLGKLSDIFSILKPILCTKLLLKKCQLDHLCLLFAKTFASSFSSNVKNDVDIFVDENNEIEESTLYDGCLLRFGQYHDTELYYNSIDCKVVLLSVSLSLSSEEFIAEVGTKISITCLDNFRDDVVFNELIRFCKELIPHASIIICQKVVHPYIKRMLKSKDILCVDRVGAITMTKLEKLLGCEKISSLVLDDIKNYIGIANYIENIKINGRNYLRIVSNSCASSKTLFLCGRDEVEGKTLKSCYQASMTILRELVADNAVLYGGGCLETKLCMQLLCMSITSEILKELKCSLCMFKKLLFVIIKSLLDVAANIEIKSSYFEHVIDQTFHHHWIDISTTSTCCCGLICKGKEHFIYTSFNEMINLDCYGDGSFINDNIKETLLNNSNDSLLPLVIHSRNVYLGNTQAAFQVAEMILRIGYRVGDK